MSKFKYVAAALVVTAAACGGSGGGGTETAQTVDAGVKEGVAAQLGGSSTTEIGRAHV